MWGSREIIGPPKDVMTNLPDKLLSKQKATWESGTIWK